jgi:hypothetical protein
MNLLWRRSLIFRLIIGLLFSSQSTFSSPVEKKNILFIGDSHTAASYAFGGEVQRLLALTKRFQNVVTLGHSSSAAIHWIDKKSYKLSGGIYHALTTKNGKEIGHPNQPHWKEKIPVLKFKDVISNMAVHPKWKESIGVATPDIIVIALGANDARSVSNSNGEINRPAFNKRKEKIESMISMIDKIQAQCIWIGPPMGEKKTQANQKTLYNYLDSAIANKCKFMSSNHYVARVSGKYCDGVHMSCPTEREKAKEWAKETVEFILKNTD